MTDNTTDDRQLAAKRAACLEDLKWAVRYRRKDSSGWITMAAFDSDGVAQRYAADCAGDGTRPWEYEAFEIPGGADAQP